MLGWPAIVIVVSAAGAVMGAEPASRPADAAPVKAFDGKSLAGWHQVGGGVWEVKDGEIVGRNGDGTFGWLVSDKAYADFELEFECKHEAAGNSGIQFRSAVIEGAMYGYQVEFDPRSDHGTGGVYEQALRGWLCKPDAKGLAAMKPMEWNRIRLRVVGDRTQVWVNGVPTTDLHDPAAINGVIAFQVHSGNKAVSTRWRNITIRDLGDGGGFRPLFDGKGLAGWHTHGEKGVWRVEGGQIVGELVKESPYAYLVTDDRHGDFELQMQMRFESNDGNSGVFIRCNFPPHCAQCNEVARKLPEQPAAFKCPKCGGTESLPYGQRVHIDGPQAEFAPTMTGAIYEAGGEGWLNEDKFKAKDYMAKLHRLGEWNDFRVTAQGRRIRTWLNGLMISDIEHDLRPEGIIALQLHAGGAMKVRFKDVRIRKPVATRPG